MSEYSHEDIKIVEEIEHVRMNPGMYIGETSNPVHLLEEAFDNSIDEALSGYANAIAIIIDTKKNEYSIIDNGRGIPTEKDIPITISTKLFSGAKFQDGKTVYEICSGLHGVGLVAINALSETFEISIFRNSENSRYYFENSVIVKKDKIKTEEKPYSTLIKFKPNKKYFEDEKIDLERVRERILIASAELKNCTFVLQIDGKQEVIKLDKETFFKDQFLNNKESSKIFKINGSLGKENFDILFSYVYNAPIMPKVISSVNILPVKDGGTHVNLFFECLKDYLLIKAKKANLRLQPNDVLCGLRCYISLELLKPELSGQSKEKLINRKTYFTKLFSKIRQVLEIELNKNNDDLDKILEYFKNYRIKMNSKKINSGNSSRKRLTTGFTKLRDCLNSNGELFIVEGDSASGPFINSRDPRIHAIFPLRGKIPSIINKKDILANKEISELIQSLGTGVGPDFDIKKLKYDKVISAVDADADGGHIFCLLTIALATLVPEIIKEGHYYLAKMPLYGITKGKNFIPIWDNETLDKYREKGENITRFKGLGELEPWQLEISALNKKTRNLIKVEYTENLENIMKLFESVSEKRKLLGME